VPGNGMDRPGERYTSPLQSCKRCINDAGFQSGMAGAARCELIERAIVQACTDAGYPAEWRLGSDGALSCAAFAPDA
jgi:hypothetical protein